MIFIRAIVFVSVTMFVSSIALAGGSLVERSDQYNDFFFPDGTPNRYLDTKISPSLKGTREFLTVLPGVLYRGGGPGGKRPLSAEGLKALCEAGFSLAYYGYDKGYKNPGPIKCTNKLTGQPNTLRYYAGKILDMKYKMSYLSELSKVANDPSHGPIFVHCWNRFHASGELAAIALRQICDWDGDIASEYWKRHAAKYPMISRIRSFRPDKNLEPTESVQNVLFKQQN